jgi:hypothetical protein
VTRADVLFSCLGERERSARSARRERIEDRRPMGSGPAM